MKKTTKRNLTAAALVGATAVGVTFLLGSTDELTVVPYEITTEKVTTPLRLVLLTDLHSCDYTQGRDELLRWVDEQAPDLVLMAGDMIDDDLPRETGYRFVASCARRWPTYYVSGNHEFRTGEMDVIKTNLSDMGVSVLSGQSVTVEIQGQTLTLSGVDDPEGIGDVPWQAQLDRVSQDVDPDRFAILLSHRPERVEAYTSSPYDLVVSGHAHGGQWRLPKVLNGLLAPNQGFFPKYAGGLYSLGDTSLIVSRGLARESTRVPRLFNPPELVVIDLIPSTKQGVLTHE